MNRTIDDQYGDSVTGALPLFFPTTGVWNIGQTCTGCAIHAGNPIDPAHVFDGTWHDTSGGGPDRIVQVSFTGHAVYVYHIVLNILVAGASTVTTNLSFYIDSNYVGNYTHIPTSRSSASPVSYQMLVYSNNSMVQGEHTLEIVSLGSSKALVLFDYITYTTSEDNSQSSALPPSTALTASQTLARSTMETSSLVSTV
ncbi:hypothetical protein C8Q70DRAFT_1053906 [Cubamyces menziesii]|nr:hypothetical protein C8Q70DRAFT_1053906 [Cubamyces menziesii]